MFVGFLFSLFLVIYVEYGLSLQEKWEQIGEVCVENFSFFVLVISIMFGLFEGSDVNKIFLYNCGVRGNGVDVYD